MTHVKGYTPHWSLALPCVLVVSATLHAQNARFEVSADTVLLDEPFHLAVSGLQPQQAVTIRMDGNGVWRSSATFRSDEHGRVQVAEPMKLIWSATGEPRQRGSAQTPGRAAQTLVFTAEVDGQVVAADTLWRRVLAPGVRTVPVRERGLVGTAYFPAGAERRPAVLVLSGSVGGIPAVAAYSGGLASHGYVVLALAYFNAEGLPSQLANIPLEYFATAVQWLKSQPNVDTTRIGVMGGSRGGELALLLGATFPQLFRVVVATVPSNVVWPGLSDDTEAPAWTLNGRPLPSMRNDYQPSDTALPGADRFRRRLRTQQMREAEIPVERINGPVLLISAKDDQIWPSALFATRVVDRLKQHQFKFPVEHYSYENAGHMITRPYVPTTNVRTRQIHPVSHRWNVAGGTPEGQARANEDSWRRLLAFLEKYLRS